MLIAGAGRNCGRRGGIEVVVDEVEIVFVVIAIAADRKVAAGGVLGRKEKSARTHTRHTSIREHPSPGHQHTLMSGILCW